MRKTVALIVALAFVLAIVPAALAEESLTAVDAPESHSFTLTFMQTGDHENNLRTYRVYHKDSSEFYYPVTLGYRIAGTSNIVEIGEFDFAHTEANRFTDPFLFTTNPLGIDQSETCILYWLNGETWVQSQTKASTSMHVVTYDANTNSGNADILMLYVFDGKPITEPGVQRGGYSFDGWVYADPIDLNSVKVCTTATAQWTKNKEPEPANFTVSYHPNGGTGTVPVDMNRYNYGQNVTLMPGTGLTKSGEVFTGWALRDGTSVTSPYQMPSHDVTLFAVYGPLTPNVPKTGDNASILGVAVLLAGLAAGAFVVIKKRAAQR
jgi:LPXTG-motif cell wall-anchored protein